MTPLNGTSADATDIDTFGCRLNAAESETMRRLDARVIVAGCAAQTQPYAFDETRRWMIRSGRMDHARRCGG